MISSTVHEKVSVKDNEHATSNKFVFYADNEHATSNQIVIYAVNEHSTSIYAVNGHSAFYKVVITKVNKVVTFNDSMGNVFNNDHVMVMLTLYL